MDKWVSVHGHPEQSYLGKRFANLSVVVMSP